jgi:hypothetical protein
MFINIKWNSIACFGPTLAASYTKLGNAACWLNVWHQLILLVEMKHLIKKQAIVKYVKDTACENMQVAHAFIILTWPILSVIESDYLGIVAHFDHLNLVFCDIKHYPIPACQMPGCFPVHWCFCSLWTANIHATGTHRWIGQLSSRAERWRGRKYSATWRGCSSSKT